MSPTQVLEKITATLPLDTRQRVIVGIPSRQEQATIGTVVANAIEGLRQLELLDNAVFVNADNSDDDQTTREFSRAASGHPHACLSGTSSGAQAGKGTNVLTIIEAALRLGGRRLVLLDADVTTGEPDWIADLLHAVDLDEPVMATPVYRRNRFEGNTTNHIASPLIGATFGRHVEQPVAGDFAFNRAFLEKAITWHRPESAHLYGIDMHLTTHAAREQLHIEQVRLGRKIHNPGFPKILHGSQQMIDSLFHTIMQLTAVRAAGARTPKRETTDDHATRPDATLVRTTMQRVAAYLSLHSGDILTMFPHLSRAEPADVGWHIRADLWAELLSEALAALAQGHLEKARDHLVALYLCRVMTYWQEIDSLSPAGVDALLDYQAARTSDAIALRQLRFPGKPQPAAFHAGFWAAAQ